MFDTFCFCHFHIKLNNIIALSVLLLLSGDIELHPGPSARADHPDNICTLVVEGSNKALCCDICDQWVHVVCDPGIEESTYDIVANPTLAL